MSVPAISKKEAENLLQIILCAQISNYKHDLRTLLREPNNFGFEDFSVVTEGWAFADSDRIKLANAKASNSNLDSALVDQICNFESGAQILGELNLTIGEIKMALGVKERMVVRFSHEESGFCRVYYHILSINGKALQSKALCCKQGEYAGADWYSCTPDYLEPDSEIRSELEIVDEKGNVLREAGL